MSDDSLKAILKEDFGVNQMSRLYASLNDWYNNIHQERRGVRACERVCRVRDRGLVPLAQRYFEFIADLNEQEFNGEAEELLQDWADENRPAYVEEAEEYNWDEFDRSVFRVHLDPEIRIASFAHKTSIIVNNQTINAYDIERISDELEAEFESLWSDWWHRMDDLYWERRYRISKQIVHEMEQGILQSEDKTWERRKEQYPKFPPGTRIGGEKQY